VIPDKVQRAVKWVCVWACVHACMRACHRLLNSVTLVLHFRLLACVCYRLDWEAFVDCWIQVHIKCFAEGSSQTRSFHGPQFTGSKQNFCVWGCRACLQQQQHPFNGPLSRTTRVSWYQKGKIILDLLEQDTVCGSDISWILCTSVHHPRQITTPASHQSFFYRPGSLPAAQQTALKHCRYVKALKQSLFNLAEMLQQKLIWSHIYCNCILKWLCH